MKKILLAVPLAVLLAVFSGFSAADSAQAVLAANSTGVSAESDSSVQSSVDSVRSLRNSFKELKDQELVEKAKELKTKGKASIDALKKKIIEARKAKEDKRKDVLIRLIDLEIKHFKNTADRVAKMPNIAADTKAQIKTAIDNAVQKLNDQKIKVQAATGDEAVKALAKETKDLFKTHREIVKKIVEAIHSSRENKFIIKAEERLAAVETKIGELKAQGKNVSELETIFAAAKADISAAKEKLNQKAFKEANDLLKSAYNKLKSIAEKAKAL